LLAVFYALKVQVAANHVIAYTWKVRYTATAYQYYGMFLKVVAFAAYISPYFISVSQAHAGYFAKGRVRLLRGLGSDFDTNAALERGRLFIVAGLQVV
jgi:hypothetical protein